MKETKKKFDKTLPGKDQGYSLAWCLAHDRLYSREVPGLLPYLYIIPFSWPIWCWISPSASPTGAWGLWG